MSIQITTFMFNDHHYHIFQKLKIQVLSVIAPDYLKKS